MNTFQCITASLATFLFSTAALAETGTPDVVLRLDVLSRATSQTCDASHEYSHQIRICDRDGCRSLDIGADDTVTLRVEKNATVFVDSSVSYRQDGVLHGDAVTERLSIDNQIRFAQTLSGKGSCLHSVYYQLTLTE